RTPLHLAARKGHHNICAALVAAGANIEAKDMDGVELLPISPNSSDGGHMTPKHLPPLHAGRTPLHVLFANPKHGVANAVLAVLAKGANQEATDTQQNTEVNQEAKDTHQETEVREAPPPREELSDKAWAEGIVASLVAAVSEEAGMASLVAGVSEEASVVAGVSEEAGRNAPASVTEEAKSISPG
ncbi:hypothetical protein T484DRAFT_1857191, partial [Baffinella frigidus]